MRSRIAICINNVAAQDLPITKNQLLYIMQNHSFSRVVFCCCNSQIAIPKNPNDVKHSKRLQIK